MIQVSNPKTKDINNTIAKRVFKARKMACGGKMRKYAFGDEDITYPELNSENGYADDFGKGALKGAASGAVTGATFGPWGAAIGGVAGGLIGGVSSLIGAKKQDKQALEQYNIEKEEAVNIRTLKDKTDLSNFKTRGKANYYANGGDMNATIPNSNSVQIADNAEIVTADNGTTTPMHGQPQGDVPVEGNNGMTTAYVEPGEIIVDMQDGSKVALSKRLGFADKYQKLNQAKELTSQQLKLTNNIEDKNTLQSKISSLDITINNLPKEQEQVKSKLGVQDSNQEVPKHGFGDSNLNNPTDTIFNPYSENYNIDPYKYANSINTDINPYDNYNDFKLMQPNKEPGIFENMFKSKLKLNSSDINKVGKVAETALPFIDNIINANMTKNTPAIPKPIYTRDANIDTNYDINAPLAEISGDVQTQLAAIDSSINNPAIAAALKNDLLNKEMTSKNTLYGTKINSETQLRNMKAINAAETYKENAAKLSDYQTKVAMRKAGMQQDYSKNLAEAEGDINDLLNRRDAKRYQDMQIGLADKLTGNTGVFNRNLVEQIFKTSDEAVGYYMSKGMTKEEAEAHVKANHKYNN